MWIVFVVMILVMIVIMLMIVVFAVGHDVDAGRTVDDRVDIRKNIIHEFFQAGAGR